MQKRITIKIFILFLILSFILSNPLLVFSQTDFNEEIKELNNEIQSKKKKIDAIQEKKEYYSRQINEKQKERASLNNQLSILENRVAKAELDIEDTEMEISKINLEIKKVSLEINNKNNEIEIEKEHMANLLKILYQQSQISALEIMLLNNSLSDFLNQMKYLEDTNKEVSASLDNLKKHKKELEKDKSSLEEKNKNLAELKSELEEKKLSLVNERENKGYILDQVQSSEKEYQRLLTQAKLEQEQASADIVSLEKSVRAKIAQKSGEELKFNDKGIIWPVPKNVITSYFHDPDYPFRYIFEHPAIDIRAAQGTALRAAASGYVARVKLQGNSYGYIMIVHGDGLSTVYGHISKSYVSEDEYVVQGQTIGLSGGLPGTPGAGYLTTGPHLHFEIRLNGIPVNPLEYLP